MVSLRPWAIRIGAAIFRFGFWASRILCSGSMFAPGRTSAAGARPPNEDAELSSPRQTLSICGYSSSARSDAISVALMLG